MENISPNFLSKLYKDMPSAKASIRGGIHYPDIKGMAYFYQINGGVLVSVEVCHLPMGDNSYGGRFFGFHIHEGNSCSGNSEQPFSHVGHHFNPDNTPHPDHAGDFSPLLGCNGYAWSSFVTNRFTIPDIISRTIIIHLRPDDFRTQPSGDVGEVIACGEIIKVR